jgi:hypothetical protein
VKTFDYAALMEQSIADNLQNLKKDCSTELGELLDRLIACQQQFLGLVQQAATPEASISGIEVDLARLIGPEAEWASLRQKFDPGAKPIVHDFTVLWSVYAMEDKATQFYQQATSQAEAPQIRLFLNNITEIRRILSRRIGGVERIVANQVWKAVGFAPGLLGKEY